MDVTRRDFVKASAIAAAMAAAAALAAWRQQARCGAAGSGRYTNAYRSVPFLRLRLWRACRDERREGHSGYRAIPITNRIAA